MNNYALSNNFTNVNYNKFDKTYYTRLSNAKSITERLEYSNQLITYLCKRYHITPPQIKIIDTNQPHNNKTHKCGDYSVNKCVIRIWNRTAKIGKEVSIKQYISTLLHEFMHHYDYQVLHLSQSIHSRGFYLRLNDLENKLKK